MRHPAARSASGDIVSQFLGGDGVPEIGTMERPSVSHASDDVVGLSCGSRVLKCAISEPTSVCSRASEPTQRIASRVWASENWSKACSSA
jgi:hypothetical protein